jgi:hypothetical protein
MKALTFATSLAAAVLAAGATAEAATYTINNLATGYVSSQGNFTGIRPNTNYLVGLCNVDDCKSSPGEYRNFFYFEIPMLTAPITSVSLVIPTQSVTLDQSPSLTYQVTSLDIPTTTLGGGDFASLGTGVEYATRDYSVADQNVTISLALDSAAIAALGSGGITFGVSGRVTSPTDFDINAPDQVVFGYSQRSVTQLMLTTVPEPSTWAMMALGFVALSYAGCRRRRGAAVVIA